MGRSASLGLLTAPSIPLTNDVNAYSQLAISADGKTLATVLTNVDSSIAYYKGDGGAMISSTPLRVTPTSLAWADEDHLWLITRGTGISKLERTTGTLQPIDTGDLDIGSFINTCPDGHVLFIAIPKGGGESRLFRMDGRRERDYPAHHRGHCSRSLLHAGQPEGLFHHPAQVECSHSLPMVRAAIGRDSPERSSNSRVSEAAALTRDTKFALALFNQNLLYFLQIWDLSTHRMVHQLPWDVELACRVPSPAFAPDGKAVVLTVVSKGSNALQYQPIDGSPTHLLTDPTHETQTGFAWSPSGSKLAVLQLRQELGCGADYRSHGEAAALSHNDCIESSPLVP